MAVTEARIGPPTLHSRLICAREFAAHYRIELQMHAAGPLTSCAVVAAALPAVCCAFFMILPTVLAKNAAIRTSPQRAKKCSDTHITAKSRRFTLAH